MKIALFGGSFDPPHFGHDEIVKKSLEILDIDKLIIMPTYKNPFKQKFSASPKMRYEWCKKIWQIPKVEVSNFEIKQNQPTPTIKSVEFLKNKYNPKKFYLLIGADNLKKLSQWSEYEKLKNMVEFVIITRDNEKIPKNLQKININANISSTFIRENPENSEILPLIKDEIIKFYKGVAMQERAKKIAEILDLKKAENVEIIDMSDKDYIAKFVVIATTLTSRHALSLIDELKTNLKPAEEFLAIESSDDWSVIDMGDIIVHLMNETYRAKYNIEEFLQQLKKEI